MITDSIYIIPILFGFIIFIYFIFQRIFLETVSTNAGYHIYTIRTSAVGFEIRYTQSDSRASPLGAYSTTQS